MPNSGKKLPVIIDHLVEFVDKLLNRIANESPEGCASLVTNIEIAKQNYNKPIESWLQGWFYQYTRIRGPEVEHALKGMGAFPDSFTRLQEFKILVGKGEWNVGSFNYYLFVELIKEVPDYQPIDDKLVHPIILRVKDLIIEKIDVFIFQYKANQKEIDSRKSEEATITFEPIVVNEESIPAEALLPPARFTRDRYTALSSLFEHKSSGNTNAESVDESNMVIIAT